MSYVLFRRPLTINQHSLVGSHSAPGHCVGLDRVVLDAFGGCTASCSEGAGGLTSADK